MSSPAGTPGVGSGLRARVRTRLTHYELDVTLTCGPGELLALVGPSGSGKTTLLRCLAGLMCPDAGDIACDGDLWQRDGRMLATPQARRVGLLSQDALLFPHMTVLGNVRFAAGKGAPKADSASAALALLQDLGVAHLRHCRPHQISGGERQRVALCQVLARRPRLLLLDEPFSALDLENRLALRRRLLAIRDGWQVPVVHVTHDLPEALELAGRAGQAGRVISLRNGREDPSWLARQMELLHQTSHAPLSGRPARPARQARPARRAGAAA